MAQLERSLGAAADAVPAERRQVARRSRLAGPLVVAALAALAVAVGACGSGGIPRSAGDTQAAQAPATTTGSGTLAASTAASTPATPPPRPRRHRPSPGTLPQTHVLPSPRTAAFRREMARLWRGIVDNSASRALPAFFPRAAYVQLKAIGSPAADWRNRLVADYGLDIAAAHRLLGAGATGARLLAVHVPQSYAHWVPPGVCDNGVGYYEVPNARVVYREGGDVRSFGIASMISWRGLWYVVHLGAILRGSEGGVVDEPSSGPGESAYSGTC